MATMEQKTAAVSTGATPKVHKNFIGGEWIASRTGHTFENLNPADTREVVGIFQKSGKDDVDQAIDAASQAYKKWRLVPAPRRAEILYKASELLIQRKEEYAQLMTREMGKVIKRRAATCRKPSTAATTPPAKGAACLARPCPRSCLTSSPWPSGSRWASAP